MNTRFRFTRGKLAVAALLVIAASVAVASAIADSKKAQSEHWGEITRNTIGSPVADLRDGPFGSFGVTGPAASPPFGDGSLGISVADNATTAVPPSEKATFGNEVDFFGDNLLSIDELGFHVFQTGENASISPRNMPNITFEMDANLNTLPADNYTSMVWVPDPAPVVNQWSGYIDAASTGNWYFTGAEGAATGCTQALNCDYAQAKAALNDGGAPPFIYTVAVGKGRDNRWAGAVDGLRLDNRVFDFEADGVKEKGLKHGSDDDDDEDD